MNSSLKKKTKKRGEKRRHVKRPSGGRGKTPREWGGGGFASAKRGVCLGTPVGARSRKKKQKDRKNGKKRKGGDPGGPIPKARQRVQLLETTKKKRESNRKGGAGGRNKRKHEGKEKRGTGVVLEKRG